MNRKVRAGLVAFGVGLLVAPLQVATAETTPAPPGASEAVALRVGNTAAVGYTKAQATPEKGEATANAVELNGKPLTANTGGTQSGKGKSEGAFLDTKDTAVGRVRVAPWEVKVEEEADKVTSEGDAALLKLVLLNSGTARVNVLHTRSNAEHRGMESTGATESDGAYLQLGGPSGLTVILLHSETSSQANGSKSYVAKINNSEILSSNQAGTRCAIAVPGVITLGCLNASGGKGATAAAVADGTLFGPTGPRLAVLSGRSAFGSGAEVLGTQFTAPAAPDAGPRVAAAPDVDGPSRDLAVTGFDVWQGVLVGLALLALGAVVLSLQKAWAFRTL